MVSPKKRLPRRVKRFPVSLKVKELNGQQVTDTYIVDISTLGAKVESSTPLAPRNNVNIKVRLSENEQELHLSGQVRWLRPLVTAPGRFQMGVQFYGPKWEIERLMASRL